MNKFLCFGGKNLLVSTEKKWFSKQKERVKQLLFDKKEGVIINLLVLLHDSNIEISSIIFGAIIFMWETYLFIVLNHQIDWLDLLCFFFFHTFILWLLVFEILIHVSQLDSYHSINLCFIKSLSFFFQIYEIYNFIFIIFFCFPFSESSLLILFSDSHFFLTELLFVPHFCKISNNFLWLLFS